MRRFIGDALTALARWIDPARDDASRCVVVATPIRLQIDSRVLSEFVARRGMLGG